MYRGVVANFQVVRLVFVMLFHHTMSSKFADDDGLVCCRCSYYKKHIQGQIIIVVCCNVNVKPSLSCYSTIAECKATHPHYTSLQSI